MVLSYVHEFLCRDVVPFSQCQIYSMSEVLITLSLYTLYKMVLMVFSNGMHVKMILHQMIRNDNTRRKGVEGCFGCDQWRRSYL